VDPSHGTALRYTSHPGLRRAELSVTDWLALYRANIEVESAYRQEAVSSVGAIGLGQLMPDTARDLGVDPRDPLQSLDGSARYLAMMLHAFGDPRLALSEAVDAIRGDIQLARRLDEHHLPNWRDDAEFSDMIQTLIAAMPLEKKSNLKVKSLKQVLALTGGVTSRIFALIKNLSIDAILTGEESITDDAIRKWTPVWSRHATVQRRLEKSGA